MKSLADVKKCPFCGVKGLGLFRVICMEPKWHQVHCQNCGARGPVGETFDEAVDSWNAATADKGNDMSIKSEYMKDGSCRYNEFVCCESKNMCGNCGWNPSVIEARKAKIEKIQEEKVREKWTYIR